MTELVLNAAKHAFGSDSAGHVFVGIERDDRTGGLRLVIADDGAGLPDVAADHSRGLAIVDVLSRSLEADCRCTTGAEGARFEFSIPASAQVSAKI